MSRSLDKKRFHLCRTGVKNRQGFMVAVHGHPKHLIKIAIIEFSVPPDTERMAAHESLDCCGVKAIDEELLITLELAKGLEIFGITCDRHVGNSIKFIKNDPVVFP